MAARKGSGRAKATKAKKEGVKPTKQAAGAPRTPPAGRKVGRPSKRTPELDNVVRRALQRGLSLNRAADLIGVSAETLRRWRASDDNFEATIKTAQAGGVLVAAEHLWRLMEAGNVAATIFWLKTRTEEFREHKQGDRALDTETLAAELEQAAKAMRGSVQGPDDGYA